MQNAQMCAGAGAWERAQEAGWLLPPPLEDPAAGLLLAARRDAVATSYLHLWGRSCAFCCVAVPRCFRTRASVLIIGAVSVLWRRQVTCGGGGETRAIAVEQSKELVLVVQGVRACLSLEEGGGDF
jgi:hypothetical protein